jgi:hypothetical protein
MCLRHRGMRDRALGQVDKAHQIVDTAQVTCGMAQATVRWE